MKITTYVAPFDITNVNWTVSKPYQPYSPLNKDFVEFATKKNVTGIIQTKDKKAANYFDATFGLEILNSKFNSKLVFFKCRLVEKLMHFNGDQQSYSFEAKRVAHSVDQKWIVRSSALTPASVFTEPSKEYVPGIEEYLVETKEVFNTSKEWWL